MTNTLLAVSDVSKRYGDVVALDNVSIDIYRNEFFALLGPSGCGKTTLLRAIAGFEDPDSGAIAITIDEQTTNLLALPPHRRPINLMFQSYALFPHMSVRKNIAYGLEREGLSKAEVQERVDEALVTVALTDKASARPAQLSGGQRQRVALARAIVKRPRLLLLDEPLSALDRKVRAEMQIELKRLQHEVGITFVVVTHDQEEAMSMADRIAVMHEGRVEQIADPVTLYQKPNTKFVADFIGSGTLIAGVATQSGLQPSSAAITQSNLPAINPQGITGAAALLVRPEAVQLTSTQEGLLTGTVLESHFYGGSSTTTVRVGDLIVVASHPGAPRSTPGSEVGLRWSAEDAVLIEDHS
jgi:ABC-type Fe3+/spermidine/putrescine transport system ATPase subunit